MMRFSSRTAWQPGLNAWAEALASAQASGQALVDLTVSNPTACGLGPRSADVLAPLGNVEALRYTPDPLGMPGARKAVQAYYADRGCDVPLDRICLTTSTSEAYSFLFRLLCDPGDEVLIARPSYPLFDLLAVLDDVKLREYPLFYEPGMSLAQGGGWTIDFPALEALAGERTRAVIAVHPNNPTGHYLAREERERLVQFCRERELALIVDEVFLDYALADAADDEARASFADVTECLCFVLSGLSKICALPQMKASWIVTCGPEELRAETMHRLEIIADTFLSMNAPVQFALPEWLKGRHGTQKEIRSRLEENVRVLDEQLRGSLAERLALQGGWTAVLRVPRFVDGEAFAYAALQRGAIVQPGDFYGLPDGRCVVSLLTEPEAWRKGLELLPVR